MKMFTKKVNWKNIFNFCVDNLCLNTGLKAVYYIICYIKPFLVYWVRSGRIYSTFSFVIYCDFNGLPDWQTTTTFVFRHLGLDFVSTNRKRKFGKKIIKLPRIQISRSTSITFSPMAYARLSFALKLTELKEKYLTGGIYHYM